MKARNCGIRKRYVPLEKSILDAFSGLPAGVAPIGVTIDPEESLFGEETVIAVPIDLEE